MLDRVPGFTLTSEPAVDLLFDEYVAIEPDSVAHLDPASDAAQAFVGAIEVFTDTTADEVVVVEVARSLDGKAAESMVDQASATAIAKGLASTDPPFGGAWSYSGGIDDTWTNTVAWSQGPYSVVLTHLSITETARDTIDAAALRQAEIILDATGVGVSEEGAVADDAPVPPTEPPVDDASDGEGDDTGEGIPIGGLLVWAVVIAGAIWLAVRLRRGLGAGRRKPESSGSVDEIIERARREARDEVERLDAERPGSSGR